MTELTLADALRACDHAPAATTAPPEPEPFSEDLAIAELTLRLRYAAGELARRTGKTPRTIFEEEFIEAPRDDWWRAIGVSS